MKSFNLKDKSKFTLLGSDALKEEGFRRLSISARENISVVSKDVSWLATHSAGISARFITNAKTVRVKVTLDSPHDMSHMPATGQCGVDLYIFNEKVNQYVFHEVSKYDIKESFYELDLFYNEDVKFRQMWINLPLYMGVKEFEIISDDEAIFLPNPFESNERILVYGTSITQGACSSRPGMLYTNILSRWFNKEFINMGFSGSAMLEEEVAIELSKIKNITMLIIDAEANAGIDLTMKNRLEKFIEIFKINYPNTPIILASRIPFAFDLYNKYRINLNKMYRSWLKKLVKKYQSNDEKVYYLEGIKTFGKDFTEYTVDGIHPTDLGAYKIAQNYQKLLKKVF